MIAGISKLAREIARTFHNGGRLKEASKRGEKLYAHNRADNTWSTTCHTVGDRIWGQIDKAEPMHPSEFGSYSRVGRPKDPQRLLHMEGWTEVWLYTKAEWTLMLYKETFGHDWKPKL
jgi:hypothetical protein